MLRKKVKIKLEATFKILSSVQVEMSKLNGPYCYLASPSGLLAYEPFRTSALTVHRQLPVVRIMIPRSN